MVANIRGYTPNYGLKLINFDTPRWHTLEYSNWQLVDAIIASAGLPGLRGEWINSTQYIAGQRVFDADDGKIYGCLFTHTSAPTGTFAADRALHPTYWQQQSLDTPFYRGAWIASTAYNSGDIVYVGAYTYYICTKGHIAGATFVSAPNWQVIFDTTATITDANAAKTAAQASATSAATSATNSQNSATASAGSASASAGSAATATTQATNAANSATAAAGSATSSQTSATNSANSATQSGVSATASANSATAAANSAIEAASQAAALKGTSTTSNTVGFGSKTFTTQAGKQFNVGNWMLICYTAAPNGNWMIGQITAYAGTSLTVNVSMFSDVVGTFADWQLYISGSHGPAGVDWTGQWNSLTQYYPNDLVSYLGNVYICLDVPPPIDTLPTVVQYWDLFALGGTATIGPSTIEPFMLNSDTPAEQLGFRDRLNFLSRAGDTMTSPLTLPAADPINTQHAAHKSYVDTQLVAGDNLRVLKAGDAMTGQLVMAPAAGHALITLNKPTVPFLNAITGQMAAKSRWQMQLGNLTAESGSNAGSDFALVSYNDAGTVSTGTPLLINRATGKVDINGPLQVGATLAVGLASPHSAQIVSTNVVSSAFSFTLNAYMNAAATSWIGLLSGTPSFQHYIDTTGMAVRGTSVNVTAGGIVNYDRNWRFHTNGIFYSDGGFNSIGPASIGALTSSGNATFNNCSSVTFNSFAGGTSLVYLSGSASTAGGGATTIQKANVGQWSYGSGSAILNNSSDDFVFWNTLLGAQLQLYRATGFSSFLGDLQTNGYYGRQGQGGAISAQPWNFYWTGTAMQSWVQTSNVGNVSGLSDYRIKKDVVDLDSKWDVVKALRPVQYMHQDFTPPSEIKRRAQVLKDAAEKQLEPTEEQQAASVGAFFKGDDIEHWGFIAHELQATMIPDAATGVKDSPDTIQSPNPWTIIAALTKALQEAMTRIEALEEAAAVPAAATHRSRRR